MTKGFLKLYQKNLNVAEGLYITEEDFVDIYIAKTGSSIYPYNRSADIKDNIRIRSYHFLISIPIIDNLSQKITLYTPQINCKLTRDK